MAGAAPKLGGDSSPIEDGSRVIECASTVLERLRTLVLERFNQLPHGGGETFGVLFGARDGDELQITALRVLPTEAIFAPSSLLSEQERAAFRDLVLIIRSESDLAGLEPVGWFRAHPRSNLSLSQRDLEISTSVFPEIWQVGMVLRPSNSAPSSARLYFRDSDGALHADRAFREFMVPIGADAPQIADTPDNAEPDSSDAVFTFHDDVNSGAASWGETSVGSNGSSVAEVLRRISPGWSTLRWPSVLIAAACVVGAFYWVTRPPRGLALLVQENAGQLIISWDKTIRPVQNAQSAHLEIGDGNSKLWLELDREQLRVGKVTYKRRSADVTVRLFVPRSGAPPLEEMARFLGSPEQQLASAGDAVSQNRSSTDAASRVKPQPPRDAAYAPPARPKTSALLVPVVVDHTAAALEALPLPEFSPPARNPTVAGTIQLPAPELAPPPQLQHPALSATLQAHPELPPENFARPPVPLPPSASAHVLPTAPAGGRLLWIGRLQKNQTLKINGKVCSTGTLIGELPLRPVKFSVSPGDLSNDGIVLYTSNPQFANSVVEPPSAQNGWNRTVYTWNARFANDIAIQESPGPENGWSSMVLRSKNPKMSVIVIDWSPVN